MSFMIEISHKWYTLPCLTVGGRVSFAIFEIFALLYHLVITRRVRIFFVKLKKQKAFFSNNVSLEARGT